MPKKEESKPKVTVDTVEEPIHLADETIDRLSAASVPPRAGRASDPIVAKAPSMLALIVA